MMRQLIILILSIFFSVLAIAQEVSNVHFEQVGKKIHINYDLTGDENYTVALYCSTDAGKNWGEPLLFVTGDVGDNQEAGKQKLIIWDVLSEKEKLDGEIIFKLNATTPIYGDSGTFTDVRDGKNYKWVRIGDQVWMAENLNYKNGRGSLCYNNMFYHCERYGRLYEWRNAVIACPQGWHLPSEEEWKRLEIESGLSKSHLKLQGWRGTNEGGKLKSEEGWINGENGIDHFGFAALPGGVSYNNKKFEDLGREGNWWTATTSDYETAWAHGLAFQKSQIERNRGHKKNGFSVRCVKD